MTNAAPKKIYDIGFKVVYDTDAMELIDMEDSGGFISDGALTSNIEAAVFGYSAYLEDNLQIDPTKPICILKFNVKSDAQNGNYNITAVSRNYGNKSNIEIRHIRAEENTYLRPHLIQGTVTVGDGAAAEEKPVIGDANFDGKITVRDCAYIASCLARNKADVLPDSADFNEDGKVNVRDAAAIAKFLAEGRQ